MIELASGLWQTSTKTSIALVAVAGCIVLSGCSSNDYELHQRIEMGPFAFQVEGASSSVNRNYPDGGPMREISVQLRLLSDESRPRKDFGDFLNGVDRNRMQMITFPHSKLEDSHGHKFDGDMRRLRIQFQIRGDLRGLGMSSDEGFRAEHFDLRPEDFRLIITNPDRREGQPRSVSIQL